MSGGSRKVALVAAVVAATLLPHPAVGDQRDELAETRRRLGQVEAVLGDARADAVAVAAALVALEAATDEVGRQEGRLAEQVRGAYMTGRVTGLAVVVQATDLRDLVERAVTLSYVISADQDVLGRLEVARRRAVQLHGTMVRAEHARVAPASLATLASSRSLARWRTARTCSSSVSWARTLASAAAAALRSRSAELRRLIRQEELARRRAAGGGGSIHGSGRRCDLSGTSPAEYWIIMKESSGFPTADNPTSTAFGLGQLLLGNRILYLGQDYATTDCGRQLWAFRAYVHDRYGTAARAKAFWQANGWY